MINCLALLLHFKLNPRLTRRRLKLGKGGKVGVIKASCLD